MEPQQSTKMRTHDAASVLGRGRWSWCVGLIAIVLFSATTSLAIAHQSPTPTRAVRAGTARPVAVAIDRYLHRLAADGRFAGSVLVARGPQVVLAKGYGLADVASG